MVDRLAQRALLLALSAVVISIGADKNPPSFDNQSQPISQVVSVLQPEYFAYPKSLRDPNRVYSEHYLSPEILAAIYERNRLFSDFSQNPVKIYLQSKHEENRKSEFDTNTKTLKMNALTFSQPRFLNEGWLRLDHGLAVLAAENRLVNNPNQRLNRKLEATFINLQVAAGYYDSPLLPECPDLALLHRLDSNFYFSFFNESTYVPEAKQKEADDKFARPYSPVDLFASLFASYVNFSPSQIALWNSVTKQQREPLKNTIEGVSEIINELEPYPGWIEKMMR